MEQFPIMPEQASEHAYRYDSLFWTITGLTAFFTILVVVLIFYMVVKYRTGTASSRKGQMDSHLGLELSWTGIPLVLALGIFLWATYGFMKQRDIPENATEIFVIGKQWMWHIQHMNGIRENNEMHVPVNTPIKLTMISQDVLHAMYLPEMRTQYHVVPGRYTALHFTPTKIGEYKMLCAMHCGTQHSEMVGKVIVMSQEDYQRWLGRGGNRFAKAGTMEEAGKDLYGRKGCGNCHTDVDNERGPTLYGLIGRTRTFTNGSSAVADEDYVRESILTPYERLNAGYENTMPMYKGFMTEEQVQQLVVYIRSLGATSGANGGTVQPYEQPDRPPTDRTGAPKNATDIANERKSAPASQFQQRGDR